MNDGLKSSFPPVGSTAPKLLILGSLPGERSLAEQRYYAHPFNQFWTLLGEAITADLATSNYAERLAILADRRIALWDVVAQARRSGSLDGAIRDVAANPLSDFVGAHRDLRAIGFNGKTAARIGRKALAPLMSGAAMIDLPSSSPAFTAPISEKMARWAVLGDFAARPLSVTRA